MADSLDMRKTRGAENPFDENADQVMRQSSTSLMKEAKKHVRESYTKQPENDEDDLYREEEETKVGDLQARY